MRPHLRGSGLDSGSLTFDAGVIHYRSRGYGEFDLPLSAVRVLGESTNESGPFIDDWFLCFATYADTGWYEASVYAEGCQRFREDISAALGSLIDLRLANSTTFASRVLWPSHLKGEPMFVFSPIPPASWLGRLFRVGQMGQTYAPAVAAILAAH